MRGRVYNKKKIAMLLTIPLIAAIIISAFVIREHRLFPNISSIDTLMSLPYLAYAPAGQTMDERGVVKYNRTKAFPGLNIYANESGFKCYLIDMYGNPVHTWSTKESMLRHAVMRKNNDLVVILENKGLAVLDWNSNIKWMRQMRCHHAIAIAENNDIYTLASKKKLVFKSIFPFSILNDYIVVLSSEGQIKREISLFDLLKNEIPLKNLIKIYPWLLKPKNKKIKNTRAENLPPNYNFPLDVLHTNAIDIIDRDIPGLCKKGDVLVSMSHLDLIAILDIKKGKVIWKWGQGELDKQHDPVLLKNNNILIFDNGSVRGYSRIIELNPFTKQIVWEYKANPPKEFFSYRGGANQRLPNGNTLITETEKCRVFEITHDGEIVWEFYEPEIKVGTLERAMIPRMMRITDVETYPQLKNIKMQ